MNPLAATYTPSYIEQLLRGAIAGNHVQQWELFDLMEDTWPRLVKNLNQLKRSVIQLEWDLETWAEEDAPPSDSAEERRKLVSTAVWGMQPAADTDGSAFEDIIYDVLDAWAKGLSVIELGWEVRDAGALGQIVAPKEGWWVHPQNYAWGTTNRLGLVIPGSQNLDPFPEDKFLIARCKAKTGQLSGNALLRALAFWWSAANFNQSWLLNFAQIFGLPIRWASYDPNQPGLLDKVSDMLENMGSAAWGAFPTGTTLDLKEPMKTGTDNPQITILDRADKNCDLLILGQSGTTEISGPGKTGGSNAANEVLAGVEWKFVKAAADFAAGVLNRQLIPAILRLNYNQDATDAPWFSPHLEEQDDEKANAERDEILMRSGVAMPKKWFYGRHNIPLPQAGEEVIAAPSPLNPNLNLNPSAEGEPAAATLQASRRGAVTQAKLLDNTLEKLTGVEARWLGEVKPFFHELMAAAQSRRITDAEFIAVLERSQKRMPELFARIKHQELEAALYAALSAATVNGAVLGHLDRRSALRTPRSALEGGAA